MKFSIHPESVTRFEKIYPESVTRVLKIINGKKYKLLNLPYYLVSQTEQYIKWLEGSFEPAKYPILLSL